MQSRPSRPRKFFSSAFRPDIRTPFNQQLSYVPPSAVECRMQRCDPEFVLRYSINVDVVFQQEFNCFAVAEMCCQCEGRKTLGGITVQQCWLCLAEFCNQIGLANGCCFINV